MMTDNSFQIDKNEDNVAFSQENEIINESEKQEGSEDENIKEGQNTAESRINQLVRERHQLENSLQQYSAMHQALVDENNRLKESKKISEDITINQHGALLESRLKTAEQAKLAAHESGDIKEIMEADKMLAAVMADISQFRPLYEQNQRQETNKVETKPSVAPPAYREYQQRTAQEWIKENESWFNPNSPSYDVELAQSANYYADRLSAQLTANGQAGMISTPQFFNEVNRLLKENHLDKRGTTTMKLDPTKVGFNTTRQIKQTIKPQDEPLSDLEREIARKFGSTEEEYRKQKKLLIKSGQFDNIKSW